MTTLTRKEYDRMSREGLELPRNFTLVEEDGREKGVCLSFGAENARMQNPDVRWAVECVADLKRPLKRDDVVEITIDPRHDRPYVLGSGLRKVGR